MVTVQPKALSVSVKQFNCVVVCGCRFICFVINTANEYLAIEEYTNNPIVTLWIRMNTFIPTSPSSIRER